MVRYHSDAVDALKREATEAKAGEIEYKRIDSDHQTALQALEDQVKQPCLWPKICLLQFN